MGGGEGEVFADCGDEGGEGEQEEEGPGEGALAGFTGDGCVGAGEEACGHQSQGREGGETVVLLAAGEGEEAEDEEGPEEEGECGFVLAGFRGEAGARGEEGVGEGGGGE